MPSARCTMCGMDFPTKYTKCPVCEEDTWYNKNGTPGELWEWQAEKLRQQREGLTDLDGKQPYALNLSIVEVIHVPESDGDVTDPVERGELRASPCLRLTDVYAYQDRKLLLRPNDVVDLPNPEQGEGQPVSKLYEVQGTFRGAGGTMYLLEEIVIPDTFPAEWEVEY